MSGKKGVVVGTAAWTCSRRLPVLLLAGSLASVADGAGAAIFRVDDTLGADGPACGTEVQPCKTIQQAVDLAASNDEIYVAAGTYTDSNTCVGDSTVVCVLDEELTILGGFPSGDWSRRDPAVNTTIIDGQDVRRCVVARRTGVAPVPAASLRLEGFTIRNGLGDESGHQFGGGVKVLVADAVLRDLVLTNNSVESPANMLAGGGGASVQGHPDLQITATLERLTFSGNEAQAGSAREALGGGLLGDHVDLFAFDLTFTNNQSLGGAGSDGLGGGMALSLGSDAHVENVVVTDNLARGGDGGSQGGASFGGGLYIEAESDDSSEMDLIDAEIRGNSSRGGDGTTAGNGSGGGFMSFGGQVTMDRVEVVDNSAEGGNAGAGPSGGGGVYTSESFSTLTIRNSVIAENEISGLAGGGGAGLRILGATATASHTTFVDNQSRGNAFGLAILAGPNFATVTPATLNLEYSIVANHATVAGERTVHLQANATVGSTGNFTRNHFAGNTTDSNQGEANSGTFNGWPGDNIFAGASPATFFVNPATSDYHITNTNPPRNSAAASTEATDLDGASRALDLPRDIGADEFGVEAFRLTVEKIGIGTGTVTSTVAGINCGTDCTEVYADGTVVGLNAVPDPPFGFVGFSGDADCNDGSVTMTVDTECTAEFSAGGTLVIEKQTSPNGRPETFQFSGEATVFLGDDQTHSVGGLGAGNYTVVETDHPLFDLTSILCDDGNSTGSVATLTATYRIEAGETVNCTFTNTLTTCSAGVNDLVLPDESVGNTRLEQACNSITAGPYNIEGTGDVTFEALEHILRDDFSVETGGELTVIVNVP